MKKSSIAVLGLASLFAEPALAAEDGQRGLVLSLSCASCHGTMGKSPGAIPSLFGRSEKFLAAQLVEFKNGSRKGTVMNRIARGYSEPELEAIAKYLSSVK